MSTGLLTPHPVAQEPGNLSPGPVHNFSQTAGLQIVEELTFYPTDHEAIW